MKTYDERSRDIRTKLAAKKKHKAITATVLSLSCCFLLIAGIWVIPHMMKPAEPTYSGDHGPLVQQLQALVEPAPGGNGVSGIWDSLLGGVVPGGEMPDGAVPEDAPVADIGTSSGTYEEITDSQVEGVTEADIIKRSDRHIYYLRGSTLNVYSIEGEASRLLGSYDIQAGEGSTCRIYTHEMQMYLSQDCTTVTILTSCYDDVLAEKYLYAITLDVTDPSNIQQSGQLFLTGSHKTSRLVGDTLYVLSTLYVDHTANWEDGSTFLPGYGVPESMTYLPMEKISMPESPTAAMYTVVTKVDTKDLKVEDSLALLSYQGPIYMSQENIYLTRSYTDMTNEDGKRTTSAMTQICRISLDQGLKAEGEVSIAGTIKDQYSMDEYDGMLRVVTTVSTTVGIEEKWDDVSSFRYLEDTTNASLYCIDLSDHSLRSVVEKFAPEGESVQSVRFDGDQAYVCTSIVLRDPVFFFDLSDPDHITFKDTGTIDGYSMSLVDFADGFLMGIGYGDSFDKLKIEVYREGETSVESHCVYEVPNCWFSSDYKSYYIDRQAQLIGLGVDTYESGTRYLLLHFDGYSLVERLNVEMDGSPTTMRAVAIDGYLYMFGSDFLVEKIV